MKKVIFIALTLCCSTLINAQNNGGYANIQLKNLPPTPSGSFNSVDNQNMVSRVQILADDFSNGSNWTMNTTAGAGVWEIVSTTPIDQAQYMGAMSSTTNANGFATYNATTLNIAQDYTSQAATLTLNQTIDLSAFTSISIDFEQRYKKGGESVFLEVSNDNGTTWTSYLLNEFLIGDGAAANGAIGKNVSPVAAGSSTVKIRFRWDNLSGQPSYGWMIDDFTVNTAPDDEVQLLRHYPYHPYALDFFGSEMYYTSIPYNQAVPYKFNALFRNEGSTTATNSVLDVEVNNNSGLVFSASGAAADLNSTESRVDSIHTLFYPTATPDLYSIMYTANFDNYSLDVNQTNNQGSDTFFVTTNEWAKDDNQFTTDGIWNGQGMGFIVGNSFYCNQDTTISKIKAAFTGDTDPGVVVCAQLYEFDNSGAFLDFVLVGEACGTSDEITLDATDLSSSNSIIWVELEICTSIDSGKFYMAAIQHYGGFENAVVMSSNNYVDTLTTFLYDGSDATWYYIMRTPKIRMSQGICNLTNCVADYTWVADTTQNAVYLTNSSTYNSNMVYTWDFGDGNTGTGQFPTHNYANYGTYIVCLTIQDGAGCYDEFCDTITYLQFSGNADNRSGFTLFVVGNGMEVEEVGSIENFKIYPNPVNDQLSVSFESNLFENASILITDITGRTISHQSINLTLENHQLTISTSNLAKGVYNLSIVSKENAILKTTRFVKN